MAGWRRDEAIGGFVRSLLEEYGSLTAFEICELLRRRHGIDLTTHELGKRVTGDSRLKPDVARRMVAYTETPGSYPRTATVYALRGG